jgi:hypothetical protein
VAGAVMGAYAAVLAWVFLPVVVVGLLGPTGTPSPLSWLRPIAREVARSSPLSMAFPLEVWGLWPWSVRMGEMAALQAAAEARGEIDWRLHFIDATIVRAHQHAAGARRPGAIGG